MQSESSGPLRVCGVGDKLLHVISDINNCLIDSKSCNGRLDHSEIIVISYQLITNSLAQFHSIIHPRIRHHMSWLVLLRKWRQRYDLRILFLDGWYHLRRENHQHQISNGEYELRKELGPFPEEEDASLVEHRLGVLHLKREAG